MPDHELSLIVLVHVLNSYVQKKSVFSAHSKLPLTMVLADFASTLADYEKAFGYPPDSTPMDAPSLSQIINSSSLKNNFIIKSENGGELFLSGPVKQAQSALVSAVVDSSIKYGKILIGQLQGLKDEYQSLSSESEASKTPADSASKVSGNDQVAESDDHETSVPTTSTDATKTETSSQSALGENEAMEIDEQIAEQDSAAVDGNSEVEISASSLADEKKEEVEENDDEGLAEKEEKSEVEEVKSEVEEENLEEEEIESESTEKQNSEDLVSESLTQEEADSQAQDEENAETNEEPEIAQEEDQDIDSSRESDDSVSDEIERSSRLLLEESERDNAEVGIIEKPELADVEGDTEEETSDKTGEKEEMEDENQENEPVAESNLKDEINNTLHKHVASEPDEAEQENENVKEGTEETLEEDDQKTVEKHDTPQDKSQLNTASSRKRKAEEASVEDAESDSPKKPRKAKDTASTTRKKSSAAEPKLTPAQKYKRFQNIAINLIKSIEAHRFSSPFLTAVTAPEYSQVVKYPRDLKSIMKNVRKRHDSAVYTSVKELEREIMLMFANCVMFNKSSTPLVKIAQEMKSDVRNTLKMFEETESSIS